MNSKARGLLFALVALMGLVFLIPLGTLADSAPFTASGAPPFDAYPPLDSEGFLALEAALGEFIHTDEEGGRWIYISPSLRVEIERYSGTFERHKLVWYISDIRFRDGEAFRMYMADPKRPSRAQARPHEIARKNKVVYAQNGDLFSFRVYNKERPGLIIRDGKILHENTYTKAVAAIPPLDELALYPDGRVEMRVPGQLSGEDYLARGATDVLAFGPILFVDRVKDGRLDKSFTHREPRSALGVAAPGHFVGIMVEGRNERSAGANLQFVADRLLEKGCYEAYTLDGGQTAAMLFMSRQVMRPGVYNGYRNARRQQDIIGIGQSDSVE